MTSQVRIYRNVFRKKKTAEINYVQLPQFGTRTSKKRKQRKFES